MSKMKNWLIVSLAVVILTLSFATVLQAEWFHSRAAQCASYCAWRSGGNPDLFFACFDGCMLPR